MAFNLTSKLFYFFNVECLILMGMFVLIILSFTRPDGLKWETEFELPRLSVWTLSGSNFPPFCPHPPPSSGLRETWAQKGATLPQWSAAERRRGVSLAEKMWQK